MVSLFGQVSEDEIGARLDMDYRFGFIINHQESNKGRKKAVCSADG